MDLPTLAPSVTAMASDLPPIAALALLLLAAWLAGVLVRQVLLRLVARLAEASPLHWDDAVIRSRALSRLAQVVPALLVLAGIGLIAGLPGWVYIVVRNVALAYIAVTVALAGVTAGTLYQRIFCPLVDLRSSSLIQFVATLAVLVPLAFSMEDVQVRWSWKLAGAIAFLVIGASILAVSALHLLMRRGQAARVTSLVYLTPIFAVVLEWAMFDVTPSALSIAGIATTCGGVALAVWRPQSAASQPLGSARFSR